MKNTIILLLTILLDLIFVPAGQCHIRFRHLDTNDGLSHNGVMALYQDSRGFIWIGTQKGLDMYNGKEVFTYKFDKYNSSGLIDNSIRKISGDGDNTVYIQSDFGIVSYDIPSGRFTQIVKSSTGAMNFQNYLYYSIGNRAIRHDPETGKDSTIYTIADKSARITALSGSKDSLMIGTSDGLYFKAGTSLAKIIPGIHVWDIYRDSRKVWWITSYDGQGLFSIDGDKITRYVHSDTDPYSLSHNQTHVCCEDPEGNIWTGTFDGLCMYDRKSGKFISYRHSYMDGALSESSIWSLMRDSQGNIWAGTYYGGVNYFSPTRQDFRKYQAGNTENECLSSPVIGQMTEDRSDNLWICTEGGGLCKYDMLRGEFKWYMHEHGRNSISHNHVKCVWYDSVRQCIWAGTHTGGLNRLDLNSGKFTAYDREKYPSLPSDIVMSIIPFGDKLLICTLRGVVIFNPETGDMRDALAGVSGNSRPDYIYSAILDHKKNLWIISGAGTRLSSYNMLTGMLKDYPEISETADGHKKMKLTSIYEDSARNIWVCTSGNGLEVIHDGKSANLDSRNNGLGSDIVYSIRGIGHERYILTTDSGVSILDYSSRKFTNYMRNKEIPLSSINENSLYITHDGEIFIGGMDGLISFREEILNSRMSHTFDIYPYSLIVNGTDIFPTEQGILSEDISLTESIDLRYRQNSFSLKYTVTDYLPDGKYDLKYCLKGYSDEWFPMDSDGFVTYSKLKPGKYSLIVMASDSDGSPIKEHCLGIRIRRPIYSTAWAFIIYAICISAAATATIRAQNNRMKMSEQLAYEKRHAEDVEKMNQEKLQFFTNISHEFRTPISVITGQVKILMDKYAISTPLHSSLSRIYRSCLQLDDLISELLEFRKLDRGFLVIKASLQDLVEYSYHLYLQYQKIAQDRGIRFVFSKSHGEIQTWFDRRQMYKVINNMLSNAFKYVNDGGCVTLSVRKGNGEALIEVSNTGSVIQPEDLHRIFDRFYQSGNPRKGTGIGLHLAKGIVEKHHGIMEAYSNYTDPETTFCVHLPLDKTVFSPKETIADEQDGAPAIMEYQTVRGRSGLHDETTAIQDSQDTVTADKKYSILIVEDATDLKAMLEEMFSTFYRVISASSGEEGFRLAYEDMPDMVISDIIMSDMSGIELCRKLKNTEKTAKMPVVLLSANIEKEQILSAFEAGADDFVKKPFDVNILIARCNNLIKNHRHLPETLHRTETEDLTSDIQEQTFLNKARAAVMDNIENEDFDAGTFASAMGVSRTLLFNKLKSITGKTPKEFILDIKMEKAVSLLSAQNITITETADRLGFRSPKYFRKYFKERFGVSPSEFKVSSNTGHEAEKSRND